MAAGAKILSQLSGNAMRWVESLSRKLGPPESKYSTPTDPEYLAEQMGMPLVGLDRHATQMFDIYDPKGLLHATREANYGESQLGLVPPSFFRKAAAKLPMEDPIQWIKIILILLATKEGIAQEHLKSLESQSS